MLMALASYNDHSPNPLQSPQTAKLPSPYLKLPKLPNTHHEPRQAVRQVKTPDAHDSREKLVVALDFGTTYSGIGFCFTNQRNAQPAAILEWPGAEGDAHPKVPTLIDYDLYDDTFSWGASVDRAKGGIVGVKLLLDPTQERPLYLPTGNISRDIKKLPKPPVEIAADFIGAVYQHALREIAKEVPSDYMALCQKQFVLSGKSQTSSYPKKRAWC